mmetsp:Transcript_2099/g.3897  ORF Transcript_2099/g.3897 Transcript_2099/m.3897 type:complete len:838 (+) Transcript_2099:320-2833(+)|eukprot:CAMPEP_0203749510 /NCGR_PEP_ID=MMETSP0098-20131031/4051_1 /ASSEMBLY_ACC=CAM_ASM_000208 /TAXON_ID=96639 /ORGANISM=" , Strain NY0313808BC1" /LENGTH=837 /DNA_ID=CAMNT_0050638583 /DNA_START=1005 /DNA_END=3518 /DNA_ORIENTATION=-
MGIPALYSWLLRNCSNLEKGPESTSINVFVDMNGVIHPCCHSDGKTSKKTQEQMFDDVCKELDIIVDLTNPKKLLYLSTDGVAPLAKMQHQRDRRIRKVIETADAMHVESEFRKRKSENREAVPRNMEFSHDYWDSNVITPGTKFMSDLSEHVENFVKRKVLDKDSKWYGLNVIFSDARVPGEGEHKILDFLRVSECEKISDPHVGMHTIVGDDADFVMLGLTSMKKKVRILRQCRDFNFLPNAIAANRTRVTPQITMEAPIKLPTEKYQIIEVDRIRTFLKDTYFKTYKMPGNQFDRCMRDVVGICFLVGNDFLPHLPTIDVSQGSIDTILRKYEESVLRTRTGDTSKDWIVAEEDNTINLKKLQQFLSALSKEVEPICWSPKTRRNQVKKKDNYRRPLRQTKCYEFVNTGKCRDGSRCQRMHGNVVPFIETYERVRAGVLSYALSLSEQYLEDDQSIDRLPAFGNGQFSLSDGTERARIDPRGYYILEGLSPVYSRSAISVCENLDLKFKEELNGDARQLIIYRDDYDAKYQDREWALHNRRMLEYLYKEHLQAELLNTEGRITTEASTAEERAFGKDRSAMSRQLYYKEKMGIDVFTPEGKSFVEEMAKEYVRGMQWNLHYYLDSVPCWKWLYPFHYAPYAYDIKEHISSLDIKQLDKWEDSGPVSPISQLVSVLPEHSLHAIPRVTKETIFKNERLKKIAYPTPQNIILDPNGKRFKWQWVSLTPPFEPDSLQVVVEETRGKWKESERKRDKLGEPLLISSNKEVIKGQGETFSLNGFRGVVTRSEHLGNNTVQMRFQPAAQRRSIQTLSWAQRGALTQSKLAPKLIGLLKRR